ncbi:MAG: metalloregulator ArsR/SmtB family transcription factor [Acidobacteria bacterium]|nr:metalloregulator ArsR/SmtB family transcription factor [Acidobacteriota bacterium]
MVNYSPGSLNGTFAALSDPTRRAILARLAQSEASVTELAEPFDVSLPAILKHLSVLGNAGLLTRHKEGRVQRCRLVARPLQDAAGWIARYRIFWEKQFDSLARYLAESKKEEEFSWQPRKPHPKPPSHSGGPSKPRAKRSSMPGRTRKH